MFTHPNTCKLTLKGSSGRHCSCALPPVQLSPSGGARAVLLAENVGRLAAAGVRQRLCAPAAVYVGRGLAQRRRCYTVRASRGAGVDDRTDYEPEANQRGILGQQQKNGRTGAGGDEAGGFGWLREFGNGKMDITGLVLSTVLLMTAAAPLG